MTKFCNDWVKIVDFLLFKTVKFALSHCMYNICLCQSNMDDFCYVFVIKCPKLWSYLGVHLYVCIGISNLTNSKVYKNKCKYLSIVRDESLNSNNVWSNLKVSMSAGKSMKFSPATLLDKLRTDDIELLK